MTVILGNIGELLPGTFDTNLIFNIFSSVKQSIVFIFDLKIQNRKLNRKLKLLQMTVLFVIVTKRKSQTQKMKVQIKEVDIEEKEIEAEEILIARTERKHKQISEMVIQMKKKVEKIIPRK